MTPLSPSQKPNSQALNLWCHPDVRCGAAGSDCKSNDIISESKNISVSTWESTWMLTWMEQLSFVYFFPQIPSLRCSSEIYILITPQGLVLLLCSLVMGCLHAERFDSRRTEIEITCSIWILQFSGCNMEVPKRIHVNTEIRLKSAR